MPTTELIDSVGSPKSPGFGSQNNDVSSASCDARSSTVPNQDDKESPRAVPLRELRKVKEEEDDLRFDPSTERLRLKALLCGVIAGPSRKRNRRRKKIDADPPGSTLSTETSLADLRAIFAIQEEVEFMLPS